MERLTILQNLILTVLCMILLYTAGLYIGKDKARVELENKEVVCTIKTAMPPVDLN